MFPKSTGEYPITHAIETNYSEINTSQDQSNYFNFPEIANIQSTTINQNESDQLMLKSVNDKFISHKLSNNFHVPLPLLEKKTILIKEILLKNTPQNSNSL